MQNFSLKEFIPTIKFLAKFIGIYLVGNFLYGLYITSYEPTPDPLTHEVTVQTAAILTACGWTTASEDSTDRPTTKLIHQGKNILAVFEGCNGINVMIIFFAFLMAFGPAKKSLFWFVPLGLLIVHIINLTRITLLFWVTTYKTEYMYFMHKYFFTAILYVIVFVLWVWWVKVFAIKKTPTVQ